MCSLVKLTCPRESLALYLKPVCEAILFAHIVVPLDRYNMATRICEYTALFCLSVNVAEAVYQLGLPSVAAL